SGCCVVASCDTYWGRARNPLAARLLQPRAGSRQPSCGGTHPLAYRHPRRRHRQRAAVGTQGPTRRLEARVRDTVRTPQTITVSPVEPIAFEHGDWTGTSLGGVRQAGGIYTAKRRHIASSWCIEAELFL